MISSNSSQIIIDYFKVQYNLEQLILTLIQNECNIEENIDNLDNFILDQQINENKKELHLMLKLILSLCNNYKRSENFFTIIEKIILKYKSEILDFFQSIELFNLFKTNKRMILFLFENGFLDLDRLVSQIINHEQDPFQNYLSYFSFEFKNSALNEEASQNQEICNFDLFNQKRMLGENDNDVNGPMNLTSTIISELIKNENICVYSRKYSKSLKDICFLLFINSNITYKLLRKFLPLPHPDYLRKIYRYESLMT